jgi:hypothetical protein
MGQIKAAAEASATSAVYDNIPGIADYARRVNRNGRTKKVAIVRPSSTISKADLRISKTLDQATDAEIAMDSITGGSSGQKAVRDAIADEVSWADDGSAMSRRPFTGRGGPGNQMRIRTGKALLDYGITADQKYFTPTVSEVVNARQVASTTNRAVEDVKEVSTQEYNQKRGDLVKLLEGSTHPDDTKAYQEEISKLDNQQQGKVAVGSAAAKDLARSGNLVVRPEGAPDNFVPSGPGTYTNSYNRVRRQTKIPLTQGQFTRIGVSKEAKRKNIELMMREAPLGATLGSKQPKALAGTPISLGGARIPHDSVSFTRNRVAPARTSAEADEYKGLVKEHNTLVRLGKNINGEQMQRLGEVKASLDNLKKEGDIVVSGELASRKGATTTFDSSIIKKSSEGGVTGRTLLAMATKPGNRPGGYAGAALAGIKAASKSIQENEPITDKSQKDIYTETRMGRVVKGPGRANTNTPGPSVKASPESQGVASGVVSTPYQRPPRQGQLFTERNPNNPSSPLVPVISSSGYLNRSAAYRPLRQAAMATAAVVEAPQSSIPRVSSGYQRDIFDAMADLHRESTNRPEASTEAIPGTGRRRLEARVKGEAMDQARDTRHAAWLDAGAPPQVALNAAERGMDLPDSFPGAPGSPRSARRTQKPPL